MATERKRWWVRGALEWQDTADTVTSGSSMSDQIAITVMIDLYHVGVQGPGWFGGPGPHDKHALLRRYA